MDEHALQALPGGDLVVQGLCDLRAGIESAESLLVQVGATHLRQLSLDVPPWANAVTPEHRLYARLRREHERAAHSRHNALVRRRRTMTAAPAHTQRPQALTCTPSRRLRSPYNRPVTLPLARDTPPEIERQQIERWREMSPAEKAAIVTGLTRAAHEMALAGIRHRYPDATPQEVRLRLAILLLGEDLAGRAYPEIAALDRP